MVSPTEAILGVSAMVAAVLYFLVARLQARREVSSEARGPLRGFIIWWGGLAILGVYTVFNRFGPGLEALGSTGARLGTYILFGGIYVMLSGLVYYLMYLYTGRRRTVYVAAAFYCLLFLFMVWLVETHAPHVGPHHATGETSFHLHAEPPSWAMLTFGVALVLPPLASALAYFLLFFRTTDRTARYRIAMVSGGLVLWLGFSLLNTIASSATGEPQGFGGRMTSQMLGVLSAVLVLLAYNPPRFVQRRLALRPIGGKSRSRRDIFGPRLERLARPWKRSIIRVVGHSLRSAHDLGKGRSRPSKRSIIRVGGRSLRSAHDLGKGRSRPSKRSIIRVVGRSLRSALHSRLVVA